MDKVKALVFIVLATLGLSTAPLSAVFAADSQFIEASQKVDKAQAALGDTLTYTISVKNVTESSIQTIFICEALSPLVNYVSGSTVATKGANSVSVTDAWILPADATCDALDGPGPDGVNLGKLEPGQVVTVVFKAKVKNGVANGSLIESSVQIKKTWKVDEEGNPVNEWFQCAARTTVKGQVLGEELPETGPADVVATSVFLAYLGFLVRRIKLTRYL